MTVSSSEVETWVDWRARRRREVSGPRGAVTITHHRHPEPVEVPVVADVEFTRDGQTYRLAATAAGPDRDLLFVHFRDATSGVQSYGAGRGLRFPADHEGTVRLDFNRATLLPCSFSRARNCPLPPAENTLPIPVRAGERHAADAEGAPLL